MSKEWNIIRFYFEGKIQKLLLWYELMQVIIKTFQKYIIYPLRTNNT